MVRRKSNARSISGSQNREKSRTEVLVPRRRNKSHVFREIRHLRKSIKLLIPRSTFARLVKFIIFDLFPTLGVNRIQLSALEALQEATEAYMVQFFEDCILLAQHSKRITIKVQDMFLMRRLRGRGDIVNR
ncbi:histone H3.X-like [Nomia melanderi]|uniref:histone H3.X-like n=1 Tax=Nomia melanderi TaxID=2448451 RepID=UPI0013043AEE|nr:histone H3.3-like [Nomia melanderi]